MSHHHCVVEKDGLSKSGALIPKRADNWLANRYWADVYLNLCRRFPDDGISNFWIRYEDLVSDPVEWTGKLFRFLGSERREGTTPTLPKRLRLEMGHGRWGR